MGQHYIHNKTEVTDKGIFKPCVEYTVDGTCSQYVMILSKEDFIKAYVKYIKAPTVFENQSMIAKAEGANMPSLEEIEECLIAQYLGTK